jgi:hypothetical protein
MGEWEMNDTSTQTLSRLFAQGLETTVLRESAQRAQRRALRVFNSISLIQRSNSSTKSKNGWLVNALLFPPFSRRASSINSFSLVFFQNSASTVSNLIKIHELSYTFTLLYASHPWHNWKHLLVRHRILQKSISSTDLMENLNFKFWNAS